MVIIKVVRFIASLYFRVLSISAPITTAPTIPDNRSYKQMKESSLDEYPNGSKRLETRAPIAVNEPKGKARAIVSIKKLRFSPMTLKDSLKSRRR